MMARFIKVIMIGFIKYCTRLASSKPLRMDHVFRVGNGKSQKEIPSFCNITQKACVRRISLIHTLLLAFVGITIVLIYHPSYAEEAPGSPVLFVESGHTLAYSFRVFYETHGGIALFGLPLTEVFLEDGRPVQYFERARLEWHGDQAQVQVGALGRWSVQGHEHLPAFQWLEHPSPNIATYPNAMPHASGDSTLPNLLFFPQSGHLLQGIFLQFWQDHGGITIFGYPISEAYEERTPDGQTYHVQYFERMRMELYAEKGNQVVLGGLGIDYLAAYPAPVWATQKVSSAALAWDNVRPTRVHIPRIGIKAMIVETGFKDGVWDVPRFSIAHYWSISGYPFANGNIILAGHSGYPNELFNKLPEILIGDDVVVSIGQKERQYIVREILTLLPNETWVMNPTMTETLTLIACVPINVYTHRLVVRAMPAELVNSETDILLGTTIPITSSLGEELPLPIHAQPSVQPTIVLQRQESIQNNLVIMQPTTVPAIENNRQPEPLSERFVP